MKIIAVGMNYVAHNEEMRNTSEGSDPVIFMKADTSLLKDGKPFFIPDFSQEIHYETELVVRISRLGKNIAERFAYRYYEEVTVGIDFTAQDLQRRFRTAGLPWELSKAFDGSAAVGTFISLAEAGDISNLSFRLEINGNKAQEGTTADMLFPTDRLISYISRFFTLKTGDLIYTGTPAGTGQVQIDDHLTGYLGDRKLLDFHIR
ncbi:putative hydrolase [Bacteroidales bacterium Barb4]|nr:putative hydrolase [Bacteroidales bacterium Barb4]